MPSPHIDSFRFGQIVIDGQAHTKDVIILPTRVIAGWWRVEGHTLSPADLEHVLEAAPETLIVGQGTSSRMLITEQVSKTLEDAGIKLVALPTGEACQRYNLLREQGEVAAVLHLTC